mmetsp:Transcript_18467/g.69983  ORF Transcript_18467/g.69983 Transcript_18467/m.69983 type:complete len:228 (-) Transcript_18467:1192-1875(-)
MGLFGASQVHQGPGGQRARTGRRDAFGAQQVYESVNARCRPRSCRRRPCRGPLGRVLQCRRLAVSAVAPTTAVMRRKPGRKPGARTERANSVHRGLLLCGRSSGGLGTATAVGDSHRLKRKRRGQVSGHKHPDAPPRLDWQARAAADLACNAVEHDEEGRAGGTWRSRCNACTHDGDGVSVPLQVRGQCRGSSATVGVWVRRHRPRGAGATAPQRQVWEAPPAFGDE